MPILYQQVNFHKIFDINIDDFRRNAIWIVGGHVTETPATIMYAINIGCPEWITGKSSGHPECVYHSACDREDMENIRPGLWWRCWEGGHSGLIPLWFEYFSSCFFGSFGRLNAPFEILGMSCRPISLDESNRKAWEWIRILGLCPNIYGRCYVNTPWRRDFTLANR